MVVGKLCMDGPPTVAGEKITLHLGRTAIKCKSQCNYFINTKFKLIYIYVKGWYILKTKPFEILSLYMWRYIRCAGRPKIRLPRYRGETIRVYHNMIRITIQSLRYVSYRDMFYTCTCTAEKWKNILILVSNFATWNKSMDYALLYRYLWNY